MIIHRTNHTWRQLEKIHYHTGIQPLHPSCLQIPPLTPVEIPPLTFPPFQHRLTIPSPLSLPNSFSSLLPRAATGLVITSFTRYNEFLPYFSVKWEIFCKSSVNIEIWTHAVRCSLSLVVFRLNYPQQHIWHTWAWDFISQISHFVVSSAPH